MPPDALPTTHPSLCGSLLIAEYEIILFQIRQVLLECGYTHFLVKRASNSQYTVDYIVQRAARKNSSGFPGLNYLAHITKHCIIVVGVAIRHMKLACRTPLVARGGWKY